MDLTEAIRLAEQGRGQAEAEYVNGNGPVTAVAPRQPRPRRPPFYDSIKMVRDCDAALNDPASWLTHGYTAALHLKFLLKELGLWDATRA